MQWGWGQKQRGMSIWQIIKRWLGAGANPDRQALPDAATTPATAAPWRHWHSPQPSPALRRVAVIGPAHGPLSGDARTLAQALAQLGLQMAEAPNTQTLLAQVIATPLEWRFVLVDCAPGPLDMAQNQALAAFHASCPSVPLIALAEASTLKNLQAPGRAALGADLGKTAIARCCFAGAWGAGQTSQPGRKPTPPRRAVAAALNQIHLLRL